MSELTNKIVLWSRTGCEACQNLKKEFDAKQIAYANIDVEGKDELRDILELKYGIRHVPVAEIGDGQVYEAVTDADIAKIERLYNLKPASA